MTSRTDETTTEEDVAAMEASILRDYLVQKLLLGLPEKLRWLSWYHGTQAPPVVPQKYKTAYQLLQAMSTNAWGGLVVDTLAQRMKLQAFDTGDDTTTQAAWRILRANRLDADQRLAHVDALTSGHGYLQVWPAAEGSAYPLMLPESSLHVTHISDPENRRRVTAALKLWFEPAEQMWKATLYTPANVWKWEALHDTDHTRGTPPPRPDKLATVDVAPHHSGQHPAVHLSAKAAEDLSWIPREVDGEAWPAPNPLAPDVPMVPLVNRPTVHAPTVGISEIGAIEAVLSRTDKLTLDMLLSSDYAAFRQKWATGLAIPEDEDGNPIEPYQAAVDRVWVSDSPDTKFGSFDSTDLGPYQQVIDAAKADISATARVPSFYLVSSSLVNPPSAEAMLAAEAGMVSKVEDATDVFGEGWETAIVLAFKAAGAPLDEPELVQTVWKDPATTNIAAEADAAVKLATIGVPKEALWRGIGATPEQIARWKSQEVADQTLQLLLDETATAGDTGPTPAESVPLPDQPT